jgi:hypothetical protein
MRFESWFSILTSDRRSFEVRHCVAPLSMLIVSLAVGHAQVLLSAGVGLPPGDIAVLESRAARSDISCQIEQVKPYLGFDLRFHTYYRVTVPNKMLDEAGRSLQVVVQVRPTNQADPVYLVQRLVVPNFLAETKGSGLFAGGFDLGRGLYHVDWMMRDSGGRVCSSHWELEAKLGSREQNVPFTLGDDAIAERLATPFDDESPSDHIAANALRVKILLNVSPAATKESLLKPQYAAVLASMLRSIVREPEVTSLTLIAFNLRAQRIVYRQEDAASVDFAALSKALQTPLAGTVNYRLLQDRHSEAHFVTKLLIDQLGQRTSSQDAIIIVGPKVTLEKQASLDLLREGGATACPIFYLNYNPNPFDEPFPDTIGSALKAYNGATKYEIAHPHAFGMAMRDMLMRLGRRPSPEAASAKGRSDY